MDNIKTIFTAFLRGFIDSLKGTVALFYLDKNIKEKREKNYADSPKSQKSDALQSKSPVKSEHREGKILKRTLQCCGLNGGVFWLSIVLFEYGLLPAVQYLLVNIFGDQSEMGITVWTIIQSFLSFVFSALWILPLMVLSKLVNGLWFQDIADSAYRYSRGRPQLLPSIAKLVADITFSICIQAGFLLQTMLMNYFPIPSIGFLFTLIHYCMLYSLYSFEYKMFNMGWELHKRLNFIECNWPYFIGFGLPLSVLTSLTSSCIISGCIFSILFPLFIISANEAAPVTNTTSIRLPLFSPVIFLSNTIFQTTMATPGGKNLMAHKGS